MQISSSPIKAIALAVLIVFAACKKESIDSGTDSKTPKPYHVTGFKITPDTMDLYKFTFEDTSKNTLSYWKFGDEADTNTYTVKKLYFTYSREGDFMARLISVSDLGIRDTIYQPVKVTVPAPTVVMRAVPDEHDPSKIIFSCTPSNDVVQYAWNFRDGKTSTIRIPGAHTYTAPGPYHVTLTVTNSFRKQTTISMNISPKFITGMVIKKVILTHTPKDRYDDGVFTGGICPDPFFRFFTNGVPGSPAFTSNKFDEQCINGQDINNKTCIWNTDPSNFDLFTLTNNSGDSWFQFLDSDGGSAEDIGTTSIITLASLKANYPATVINLGSNSSGQLGMQLTVEYKILE